MEPKINRKRLLALVCAVAVLLCAFAFSGRDTGRFRAQNGRLDLLYWKPGQDGVLRLDGEWDFYWSRLLTEQDAAGAVPDLTAVVLAIWNSYKIEGKNLPGFGYATYVLHVLNATQGALALRIPAVCSAYELYIDGRLLSSNGEVGADKAHFLPASKPNAVTFTPAGRNFTIILCVANFSCAQGGMLNTPILGTSGQILSMDQNIGDVDTFLIGALTILVLFYVGFFLMRRGTEKSSLYLALVGIVLAGRTAVTGSGLIYRLLPSISFETMMAVYYITLCWLPVCSALAVGELFPQETPKKAMAAVLAYTAAISLVIPLTPVSFYTRLIYLISAAGVLLGAYSIFISSMALLRGRKDALIVLLWHAARKRFLLAQRRRHGHHQPVRIYPPGQQVAFL